MTANVDMNMPGNMESGWYIASDTRCISVLFMLTSSETSDAIIMMVVMMWHKFLNYDNVFISIIHVSLALYLSESR